MHEQHVDATRSVQIGIRGHDVWMDPGKTSRELGYRIVTKDEFDDDLGIDGTVALIRERVGDLPVYVSFDLDVLDTTIAPAVSNPEPGEAGLTMKEAIRVIQRMRGMKRDRRRRRGAGALARLTERDDGAERHTHRLRADLRDRRPPRDRRRNLTSAGRDDSVRSCRPLFESLQPDEGAGGLKDILCLGSHGGRLGRPVLAIAPLSVLDQRRGEPEAGPTLSER